MVDRAEHGAGSGEWRKPWKWWVAHMAKEAGPDAQRVCGAALKLLEKVCPVEAAKPLSDTQGCSPGAPKLRS